MKVILTKILCATEHKGTRVKAYDDCGNSTTIPYPYELSGQAIHEAAARQLIKAHGWKGILAGGRTKEGYTFVLVPKKEALK